MTLTVRCLNRLCSMAASVPRAAFRNRWGENPSAAYSSGFPDNAQQLCFLPPSPQFTPGSRKDCMQIGLTTDFDEKAKSDGLELSDYLKYTSDMTTRSLVTRETAKLLSVQSCNPDQYAGEWLAIWEDIIQSLFPAAYRFSVNRETHTLWDCPLRFLLVRRGNLLQPKRLVCIVTAQCAAPAHVKEAELLRIRLLMHVICNGAQKLSKERVWTSDHLGWLGICGERFICGDMQQGWTPGLFEKTPVDVRTASGLHLLRQLAERVHAISCS